MRYAHLHTTTNFTFLTGASHPPEYILRAAELEYDALAITDECSFAGIVKAFVAAKELKFKLIIGSRFTLSNGMTIIAIAPSRKAYAELSGFITLARRRAPKGEYEAHFDDLRFRLQNCLIIWVGQTDSDIQNPQTLLETLANAFKNRLWFGVNYQLSGGEQLVFQQWYKLAQQINIPLVACGEALMHEKNRKPLQDVLTAIRHNMPLTELGTLVQSNAEAYLKSLEDLGQLYPESLLEQTCVIADLCEFSLNELRYQYPEELVPESFTPIAYLRKLVDEGKRKRWPQGIPATAEALLQKELSLIEELKYEYYFLTVHDIVCFARQQEILCQGRGSAANSVVCYCLFVTEISPGQINVLFERFISKERDEPPDIDVDFEHERREEVMQYIFNKYGRDRAAIIATVTQQHQKGAIRDVGKAMGLSVDTLKALSGSIWEFTDEWFKGKRIKEQGLNPGDLHLQKVLQLTKEYIGFPRQLGQHTGGFVITRGKLSDLCPIMNARMIDRTCIEWNKDDIDALGFMKIDVLALGMLTCIRKSFDIAKENYNLDLTLANIPQDVEEVYDMICHADTIGVFQIESRAQQSMLPRLRPRCFYDLVIEVAIVRPGPIQGDMVHPYLRRRNGEEPVEYPSKELEEILGRTLGVPLFQEQAMKIAIVAANFTAAEADGLRRSMATFKAKGLVTQYEEKLISGMIKNGYKLEYAQRVFKQLEGFGSYGFPESHAASFALLVYVSSWMKCFYPDVFCCAILNSMPMGFYQPAQLITDAKKHGVEVREIDVNFSHWDNKLEERSGKYCSLRLGFRQVKSLRLEDIETLLSMRKKEYRNMNDLRIALVPENALELLADADAFRSVGLDRRQALWEVSTKDRPVEMFSGQQPADAIDEKITLPLMAESEHVVHDYASTSFSLKAHPVKFIREKLQQLHIVSTNQLSGLKDGSLVKVAGLVLVRQRPGTAGGICFMTIEDETGFANLVIFEKLFDEFRKEILQARLIMVEGKVQIEGEVIHVIVKRCHDFSKLLRHLTLSEKADPNVLTLARPDEKSIPVHAQKDTFKKKEAIQESIFPVARNFK